MTFSVKIVSVPQFPSSSVPGRSRDLASKFVLKYYYINGVVSQKAHLHIHSTAYNSSDIQEYSTQLNFDSRYVVSWY